MIPDIPMYLYRGDSDPRGERKLKETFHTALLLTAMANGGNGREIFSAPLNQLINRHVGTGWHKSHFFSFSADEKVAINYGSNFKQNYEVYDDRELWDFTVVTFDTTRLIQNRITLIQDGIYSAQFAPLNREFLPIYNIILIDVFTHLRKISVSASDPILAISNAERDKEWLILPTAPFEHRGEFTGKLDTACVSDKRIFRWQS